MRAIVVRRFGAPDVLAMGEAGDPVPAPGEARIRVAMAGVNFTDTERRRGVNAEVALPWIPGIEAAGTVESVAAGVHPGLVGRRVAAVAASTYAELAVAPASELMLLPDALSWEQAAAFPVQGLTAYHVLHDAARMRPGETVLVHAAAGGVGTWLVRLARRAGARVFGVCSTEAKAALVRASGADDAFVTEHALAGVRALTDGRGVDVVLDPVGRETRALSLAALAPFGRLVCFGNASGAPDPFDPEELYDRSLQVGAYWLRTPHAPAVRARAVADLVSGIADASLSVPHTTVFPLADAAAAHRALESRGSHGKLLLRVE